MSGVACSLKSTFPAMALTKCGATIFTESESNRQRKDMKFVDYYAIGYGT